MIRAETRGKYIASALEEVGSGREPRSFKVASRRKSGNSVKVTFPIERYTDYEEYACRRTNRVYRIHSDGRVEYDENCKERKVTRTRKLHDPISIPAREGKRLRKNDVIVFVLRGGKARVLRVWRGKQLIQIRGAVLGN